MHQGGSKTKLIRNRYQYTTQPAIEAAGGKIIVRGAPEVVVPRESGLKQRVVATEFPSFERAAASYTSASYQAALKALGSGADRDFRIVEGVD